MKSFFYSFKRQFRLQLLLVIAIPFLSFSQGFSPQTTARLQHVIDSFQTNPANPYVGGIAAAAFVGPVGVMLTATIIC